MAIEPRLYGLRYQWPQKMSTTNVAHPSTVFACPHPDAERAQLVPCGRRKSSFRFLRVEVFARRDGEPSHWNLSRIVESKSWVVLRDRPKFQGFDLSEM